jgi:hypothetical protein
MVFACDRESPGCASYKTKKPAVLHGTRGSNLTLSAKLNTSASDPSDTFASDRPGAPRSIELAGGPRADVVAGLSKPVNLKLVSRLEFASGVVVMRYEPKR